MDDMKMEPIWLASAESANLVVIKLQETLKELGKVSRHDLFELSAIRLLLVGSGGSPLRR